MINKKLIKSDRAGKKNLKIEFGQLGMATYDCSMPDKFQVDSTNRARLLWSASNDANRTSIAARLNLR